MSVRIFVEGVADKKFLEDYLSFLSDNEESINKNDFEIIETKGWTNLQSNSEKGELIRNQMTENSDDDGVNLLIFDADADFSERLNQLEELKQKYTLNFDIFLWPNNSDSGDLEVVLENIINPNNSPIFDCWEKYEKCLMSKKIEGRNVPLTTPAKKTKIYGYLEALLKKSEKDEIKEKCRDYKNKEYWNLNSEYLSGLRNFIITHIN